MNCYFQTMKNIIHTLINKQAGWVLGAALVVTMTGCADHHIAGWQARIQTMPYDLEPYAFLAQDDYIYYPQYETYYSRRQHKFAYWNQGGWLLRPTFTGVPLAVVLASPSVKMPFHDSPDDHHALVLKQYPRNWPGVVLAGIKPVQPAKAD